jgi:hypothetical protein
MAQAAQFRQSAEHRKPVSGVHRLRNMEVEQLLSPARRASLPLRLQVLLYLHPFAFFKDASSGTPLVRERNLSYNRARRWMLVPYLRRWILIAASLFLGIAPAEAMAAQASMVIVPAALAVGFCIAATVTFCIGTAYLLLGISRNN